MQATQDATLFLTLIAYVFEQSFWRLLMPLSAVSASILSAYLAWVFGASLSDAAVMSFICGAGAVIVIIASRYLSVVLDDDRHEADEAKQMTKPERRRMAFWRAACVAVSVATAFSVIADMGEERIDRRAESAGVAQSAYRAALAAGEHQASAKATWDTAKLNTSAARADVREVEAAYEAHKVAMAAKYANSPADYSWSISTSTKGQGGGGLPFVRAIHAAEAEVERMEAIQREAQRKAEAATQSVVDAERAYRDARRGAASAQTINGVGFTALQRVQVWAFLIAVMLDVVALLTIGPTRRALREMKQARSEAAATVASAAQPAEDDVTDEEDLEKRRAAREPFSWLGREEEIERHKEAVAEATRSVRSAYGQPAQQESKHARAIREHQDTMADIVRMVRAGEVKSVSYDAIRTRFDLPNSAIDALREMLIAEGLAYRSNGNKVMLK